ncbi:MAG: alginate lyase family protein [Syntrophomonas sp.]
MKIIQMFKNYTLSEIGNKASKKIRLALYHQTDKKSIKPKTVLTGNKVLAVTRCSDLSELITMLVDNSRGYRPKEYGRSLDEQTIIRYADSICRGKMEILGRYTDFSDGIKWHSDFTCGYEWDSDLYHNDIKFGNVSNADIKTPWELGRLQFLYPVMTAYELTKEKRYLDYVTSTIKDWMEKNLPKLGPGWACTMDVGIRAANLCVIYNWLQQQDALDKNLALEIFRSLYSHADYITHNLEYDIRLTSNHYLSDIVGLLYIGAYFPEFKRSNEWVAYSMQELISEMKRQVHEEGTDFEASTCYHRLVTELFLSATILVQRLDTERRRRIKEYNYKKFKPLVGPKLKPLDKQEFDLDDLQVFPAWYMDRLEKMLEFIMHITKADGRIPQIGDNDSGRLHKFTLIGQWNPEFERFEEDFLDHRHLLAVGGELFNRDDLREAGLPYKSECFWYGLIGRVDESISMEEAEKRSLDMLKTLTSRAYPQFGLYIMRHEDNYMAIRCGDIGQNGQGGHAHNDQLSFVLNVGGENFFVDPGTYLYTPFPEWRNYFRSTACHNTVMVDEEQNQFDGTNLFTLLNNKDQKCLHWELGKHLQIFRGEYCEYSKSLIYCREILFDSKKLAWIITDSLMGRGKHKLVKIFLLGPTMKCSVSMDCIEVIGASSKVKLEFEAPVNIHFQQYFFSSKYGAKQDVMAIHLLYDSSRDHKIKTTISGVSYDKCRKI